MKILVFSHVFPPYPACGSRRVSNAVLALHEAGHEVEVITSRLSSDEGRFRSQAPRLRVRAVRHPKNPRFLYVRAKQILARLLPGRNGKNSKDTSSSQPSYDSSPGPGIRRLILSLLRFPDDELGFIIPSIFHGLRAIGTGDVDLIYTSSPPHSTHIAGLILKRITGVRWIMELRDPWIVDGVPLKVGRMNSTLSARLERRVEKKCLDAADRVIVVTEGVRDELLRRKTALDSSRIHVIRNGIPEIVASPGEVDRTRHPHIVYPGTFDSVRDPTLFFRALGAVREELDAEGLIPRVTLVGNCRGPHGAYEKMARECGIEDLVTFLDWRPHEEVRSLLSKADLFLLIIREHLFRVPNKTYEYLGYLNAPILAFTEAEGETAGMLRSAGGHHLVTDDASFSSACDTLKTALRECGDWDGPSNEALLESWTTGEQMRRLLEML